MASSIDWDEIADATEGFSGADLQALVYNAHLEVVHSSIASDPVLESNSTPEEELVRYTAFGGPPAKSIASRAEESAIQRRVGFEIQDYIEPYSRITAASNNVILAFRRCSDIECIDQAKKGEELFSN